MPVEWTSISNTLWLLLGSACFVVGGVRFRRWAVDDRWGVPRYSRTLETMLLWLLYSGFVASVIVVVRQTLREL